MRGPLDDLTRRESFAEAMRLLSPVQRTIAVLRLERLSDGEIAALLGRSRASVNRTMRRAARTIERQVPELASFLRGRARPEFPRGSGVRALEQGWVCGGPFPGPEEPDAPPPGRLAPVDLADSEGPLPALPGGSAGP